MLGIVTTIASDRAFHAGLLLTAFGFGFRHGIDWDHIAALTDITSAQPDRRRSMFFATLYALGHALVVLALGFAAIVLAARLPAGVDIAMERAVGATLVFLGVYVLYALVSQRGDFRMRSRWMLLFAGARSIRRRLQARRAPAPVFDLTVVEVVHDHEHDLAEVHEHDRAHAHALAPVGAPGPGSAHRHVHSHRGHLPDDPFADYAPRTAFGIGMLHGVGAETPTQILIFIAAAGAGGKGVGLLLLGFFLAGLLTSNTVVAAAGTLGVLGAARHFKIYIALSLTIAVFSLVIGTVFLVGNATALPSLLGG
jgi:hypothetical protein